MTGYLKLLTGQRNWISKKNGGAENPEEDDILPLGTDITPDDRFCNSDDGVK